MTPMPKVGIEPRTFVLPDDRKRISVHETWYSFRIEKPFSDDSNQWIQTLKIRFPASRASSTMRGNRRDRDPSDTADQLSAAAVAAGGHVPPSVQANFLLCVLRVVRWYAGMRAFTCGTCI